MEYDTALWPESTVMIKAQGKAPKKYGEGVYRFSATMILSVILPRRGWELLKQTKNYAYLRPPRVEADSTYEIHIKIPTEEQALEIATDCCRRAESWMGQIGEWPACYLHERKRIMNELVPSPDGRGVDEKLAYELPPESSLTIGEFGVWQIKLSKSDAEFEVYESGDVNKNKVDVLVEGRDVSLELTKYERSSKARELCISHHGDSCKVCGMNFGLMYGNVGSGFIHVHHIAPISEQNGEYEVDPVNDLVPLCPNCHAMAHRRNPPFSVSELKDMVNIKGKKI
jgi:5-methylcytosine-specific restriction protein A